MPEFITGIDQGSDEWHGIRSGVITASNFSKIITGTGKKSTSRRDYIMSVAAERITGNHESFTKTAAMERGNELEKEARSYFELITGEEVEQVTFIKHNDNIGCSPDGIITRSTGLEIKCRTGKEHLKVLISGKIKTSDIPQVQGCMFVAGFDSWWYLSYHPDMKPLLIKVKRDPEYQELLKKYVNEAEDELLKVIKNYKTK